MLLNIVVSLPSTHAAGCSRPAGNKHLFLYIIAGTVCLFSAFSYKAYSQADTVKLQVAHLNKLDTVKGIETDSSVTILGQLRDPGSDPGQLFLSPGVKKKRVIINASLHAAIYGGSMIILNKAWYADYPRSSFHTFNDFPEWLQVDKFGHAWSAYQISRTSMASWKWAGLTPRQQVWYGGLAGAVFQTVIEVQDGFSAEWGWSWGDIAANIAGSGLLISQQLAWHQQRISYKFSFHRMHYADKMLNRRSDSLYGNSLPERTLKDYNGQAYWLSANISSFFPQSKVPAWLNVAVGYGAGGMFGATENTWQQGNTTVDRTDIKRVREWYLAPDIDFTRIPTKSRLLRHVFFVLNAFKFPAPALMLSNGKLKVHALYF